MATYTILIPAEPISAATRQQLEASRTAAQRQVKFATAAWHAAEQAMLTERRIYDMLDCLLRAGPGHVFSAALITEHSVVLPCCRHCRAHASSITAKWACEGDTHRCPEPVRPGETDAPVKMGKPNDVLCGRPGQMNDQFTAWTCRSGHVTDHSHAESEIRHALACSVALACPWPELMGISESGL
jgi:hypothetical protein